MTHLLRSVLLQSAVGELGPIVAQVDVGDAENVVHNRPVVCLGKSDTVLRAPCFGRLGGRFGRVRLRFDSGSCRFGGRFRHSRGAEQVVRGSDQCQVQSGIRCPYVQCIDDFV